MPVENGPLLTVIPFSVQREGWPNEQRNARAKVAQFVAGCMHDYGNFSEDHDGYFIELMSLAPVIADMKSEGIHIESEIQQMARSIDKVGILLGTELIRAANFILRAREQAGEITVDDVQQGIISMLYDRNRLGDVEAFAQQYADYLNYRRTSKVFETSHYEMAVPTEHVGALISREAGTNSGSESGLDQMIRLAPALCHSAVLAGPEYSTSVAALSLVNETGAILTENQQAMLQYFLDIFHDPDFREKSKLPHDFFKQIEFLSGGAAFNRTDISTFLSAMGQDLERIRHAAYIPGGPLDQRVVDDDFAAMRNRGDKEIRIASDFHCTSCGISGNHYFSVHDESGDCQRCGSALEVDAVFYEPALIDLQESVVVISDRDKQRETAEIEEVLTANGFKVVSAQNLLDTGEDRLDMSPDTLYFLVRNAAAVLFVSSKFLKNNPVVRSFLRNAHHDEAITKLFPVLTASDSFEDMNFQLEEFPSVEWRDGDGNGSYAMSRQRLMNVLHKRVADIQRYSWLRNLN